MQRVNYGRALVELAIVRISILEDLSQIAALAQSVASGTHSPGVAHSSRPAVTRQSIEKPSKKNEIIDSPVEKTKRPSSPAEAVQTQKIVFEESSLSQFWTQLVANVPDTLKSHLQKSSRQAISGPNLLELVFPKSYLFSKSYCERPDPLKKLNEIASQLAQSEINCRFKIDEKTESKVPKPTQTTAVQVERRSATSLDKDPYVQEAVNIFGGQVVEVRPVYNKPMSSIPDDEETDS